MANNVREYNFITGPETATQPTSGTPSDDADFMTKGYADDHYAQGGASLADLAALKAVAAADRADGDIRVIQSINSIFIFDAGSSTTGDDETVVTPTAGTGRWIIDKNASPVILDEQSSTPANPATGKQKIYPKDDGKWYTLNSAGEEQEVGSGSGGSGINYIEDSDAETSTGSWATYANSVAATTPETGTGGSANITWTQNTTTPLRGTADFKLVKDGADRQGEGVSWGFAIDRADTNKTLWISFDVDATDAAYTAGDLAVYIIKDTGGTPTLVTPAYTSIAASTYQFKTSFNADSNTDYRLCIHVTSATATTAWTGIYFDNFKVGPEELIQTTPISDWTSFANVTSAITTNVTSTGFWQQINDTMHLKARIDFTGTNTDAQVNPVLPYGYSIDFSKLPTVGARDWHDVGRWTGYDSSANTAYSGYVRYDVSDGLFTLHISSTSLVNTSTNTPMIIGGSDYFTWSITVPIAEWAGSSTGMSNSRVEYASVGGTWNADSTTTVYGPGGSLMGGALTASRKKTITWLTPIQPTDTFQVQVSVDRNTWHDINASIIGASYTTPVQQMVTAAGSSLNGSGCYLNAGGTTTSIITFALYASMANDDAPAVNWPSDTYWRVLKCSNPLSIGMPQTVKWKKVEMVTNFTSAAYIDDTTDNSAFKFTLEPGKTYRISFNVNYTDANSTEKDARYIIYDGATTIASIGSGWQDTYTSSGSIFVSTIRAVTDGAIRFRQYEATTSVTTIAAGTFAIAEELPYHTAYAGW